MRIFNKLISWLADRYDHEFYEPDSEAGTTALTAKRFKELFVLHGIEVSEIPEVKGFEDITLYDLHSDDRLLQKLTPTCLEKTAEYFGIEIEWLRSGDSRIYFHRNWYKNLPNFFEDLKTVGFENIYDPFEIITTVDKFDKNSSEYQPFTLVLKKYMGRIGEKYIYRYYTETLWDWHHLPCRLQAKALATRYYQLTGRMITISKVSNDQLQKIANGYLPPQDIGLKNHRISFEEYGAVKLPHMQPYEIEEFDAIIETIKEYEIDSVLYKYNSKIEPVEVENKPLKRTAGRKIDKRKLEIKERFIELYHQKIQLGQISRSQAAKDFYEILTPDEEKILLRSAKDHDHLNDNQLEENIVRTIKDYYREYERE